MCGHCGSIVNQRRPQGGLREHPSRELSGHCGSKASQSRTQGVPPVFPGREQGGLCGSAASQSRAQGVPRILPGGELGGHCGGVTAPREHQLHVKGIVRRRRPQAPSQHEEHFEVGELC
jgi:hypothetical protein